MEKEEKGEEKARAGSSVHGGAAYSIRGRSGTAVARGHPFDTLCNKSYS